MIITVASTTLSNYQVSGSTATLRIYLTESFVSSDGVLHVADDQIYKSISCTAEDNVVTIPAFTIDSTTDGLDNTRARYSAILYDANGDEVAPYVSDFLVYPSPSSTTWADIIAVNNVYVPRPPNTYLTATQIAALFADLPDGLTQFTGYVNLADYDSFADAVSQIGSANKVLNISSDAAVSTAITIPSTLFLNFINAKLVKSGSGAITFQGLGLVDPMSRRACFQGFAAGDVTWSGSTYPKEISTELWDTGDSSLSKRIQRADAAVVGKYATIVCFPRTITETAEVTQYHNLLHKAGEYPNTLNTIGNPFLTQTPAYVMNSDTGFFSEKGAVIYQSSVPNNGYLIYARHLTLTGSDGSNANISVIGNHFKPSVGTVHQGAISVINLGNTENGRVTHNYFDGTFDYAVFLNGAGTSGNYAKNCEISYNLFKGIGTQTVGAANADGLDIIGNVFDCLDTNAVSSYVVIDLEPNESTSRLDNIRINENKFKIDDASGFTCSGAIVAQAGGIASIKNIEIKDNTINGKAFSFTDAAYGTLAVGILVIGAQAGMVSNNRLTSVYNGMIQIQNCRGIDVLGNNGKQLGGSNGAVQTDAVALADIYANILKTSYTPNSQVTSIKEAELSQIVTASSSTVTNQGGAENPRFYDFWRGLTITLNATDYTVATVNTSAQTLTTTVAVGTLTVKSIASATDVDTGTDTITSNSHGFNNGARLKYVAGTAAIGGLTTGTTYFVVNKTANTFQLAATLGGSAIDLISTGTGTQTFTPVLATKFSSNAYKDNKAADGITLEPTGTSVVYSEYDDTFSSKQDVDADLTAIAGLSSTGIIARTGSGTAAVRTVAAGSAKISVTNGNGVSGNPTVDLGTVNAADIVNTPAGAIAATNVQMALNELDTEKAPLVSPSFTTPNIGAATGTSLNLGGATLLDILTATAALDFDLSGAATQDLTVTVTGAALGDAVAIGVPHGSVTTDTVFCGWVSAADTVTIRATRISGTPNPASGTFRATVFKF